MHCDNCGSNDCMKVTIKYEPIEHHDDPKQNISQKIEYCNLCAITGIGPAYARDALGNKVAWSEDQSGKFNYATGKAHTSQRDYAEHLKKEGLVQKGNDGQLSDRSFGRIKKRD